MSRKFIIGSAIVLFVFLVAYFGYTKGKKLMEIFDQMTIDPHGVSNINISEESIKFKLAVKLTNPTGEDFSVSGFGVAKLKRVDVFYDGVFLATSKVNIDEVPTVLANNQLVIGNIPVEVPEPIKFGFNNLNLIYQMATAFDENKVTCTGVIEVAGYQIEI